LNSARDRALDVLLAMPQNTALLVDFDGTLAEIVAAPASAVPLPGVVSLLHRLAEVLGVVAVVSGRPAAFLLERLGPPGALQLFGLYGLEQVTGEGEIHLLDAGADLAVITALGAQARAERPGADIEEKQHSLALHWRRHPDDEAALRELAVRLASSAGLVMREAKMSVELLATGSPDKGAVVRRLAGEMSCVAYAGDDLGDLAAFDALDELEARGASCVRIAIASTEAPATLVERADLVLGGPAALRDLLETLALRLAS
jgi:trehalose 6-phosphate phosphatase